MRDLSLHILDLAENSVGAGATLVKIDITEDRVGNRLTITVDDNGSGMTDEMKLKAIDPFVTTRTERDVGLGLPLLGEAARQSGGELKIESSEGKGTRVTVDMELNNIDRKPMGDIPGSLASLVMEGGEKVDWIFSYRITEKGSEQRRFTVDTRELREVLDDVPLSTPEAVNWLKKYVAEGLDDIGAERS